MTRRICITALNLFLVAAGSTVLAQGPTAVTAGELADKVEKLETRLKELEDLILPMKDEILARTRAAKLRKRFVKRIEKDKQVYSQGDLREISRLYQVANRQWKSPEAKESLKKLIEKYDKANRTGCALLYLGQMASGEEKEKYLTKAIAEFSDCWYGDGVQVGAYARFHLAIYYRQVGRIDDANKLFEELRSSYPEGIDHRGNLLADMIPK